MVRMGSSSQDLAGALLVIFKTNSSVTGSKVSKGFPTKDYAVVYSAWYGPHVDTWSFLTRIRRRTSPPGVCILGSDLCLVTSSATPLKPHWTRRQVIRPCPSCLTVRMSGPGSADFCVTKSVDLLLPIDWLVWLNWFNAEFSPKR